MSNAQLNELNNLVKNSKNVKVITLKDGTVQVVDIDATNVDDGLPDAEPYAEVKGNKIKAAVQQRESTVLEDEKKVKPKRTRKPKKSTEPSTVDSGSDKADDVKATTTNSVDNSSTENSTDNKTTDEVTDK